MSNTRFEETVDATLADTQEYTVSYEGFSDIEVVLACADLTDAERALIVSKGETMVAYAAKLIRDEANGLEANFSEFVAELANGRREANRSLGQVEEL
jgi:hypothetical protein